MQSVTFDSNAWQPVVRPGLFPKDRRRDALLKINTAIRNRSILPFMSETVATLEAIQKTRRSQYLGGTRLRIDMDADRDNPGSVLMGIGPQNDAHPGLKPILSDRLSEAFALGFKLLPSSRIGIPRPPQIDHEELRIPLTPWQRANIQEFLQKISDVSDAIEVRGLGRAVLESIASRIQNRLGHPNGAWFDGLDQPLDQKEENEIAAGFAEWADGDSVALHVAYGIDVFCTDDRGKTALSSSVFDEKNRRWLTESYHVRFASVAELAEMIVL